LELPSMPLNKLYKSDTKFWIDLFWPKYLCKVTSAVAVLLSFL
jgi:hypothetical protein